MLEQTDTAKKVCFEHPNKNAAVSDSDSSGAAGKNDEVAITDNTSFINVKQSKNEKKAKKILSQHGLKPIRGVTRVVFHKTNNIVLVISNPEVFKTPWSDTYIVFGEPKIEKLTQKAQAEAVKEFKKPDSMQNMLGASVNQPVKTEKEDEGEIDYKGVDKKDMELVCGQVPVTRRAAIEALLRNDNDIVNAIMDLTI